jgi:tRNA(Ile)-lysidine synthase
MPFGVERLASSLAAIDAEWRSARFCVAYSGGLDSTALLHVMAAIGAEAGIPLRAVHVDHGLQAGSADTAERCGQTCLRIGVPFRVLTLRLEPSTGESVEAAAREARYAALERQLAPGEWLLTAHHRDDQLETVLIQLLRGAGVAGLSAMPARAKLGEGWHARPLLEVDRADLAAYAMHEGLSWQQDPMNHETRFDRAWLRTRVLPAIRDRWPAAAATVARSAGHFAEASKLLAEMAATDAAGVLDDGRLSLAGLGRLSRERRVNLLRWWLRQQGLRPPPAARLASAMRAFFEARRDSAPCLRWDEGEVRRYRGHLYALAPLPGQPQVLDANGSSLELGAGLGRIDLVRGRDGGLAEPLPAAVAFRFRSGGESLRPHQGRPRKRLKDLCQEAGIVPWMRDRLPLVYVGERLAAVGDLWVDADLAAGAGSSALKPVWTGRPRIF